MKIKILRATLAELMVEQLAADGINYVFYNIQQPRLEWGDTLKSATLLDSDHEPSGFALRRYNVVEGEIDLLEGQLAEVEGKMRGFLEALGL